MQLKPKSNISLRKSKRPSLNTSPLKELGREFNICPLKLKSFTTLRGKNMLPAKEANLLVLLLLLMFMGKEPQSAMVKVPLILQPLLQSPPLPPTLLAQSLLHQTMFQARVLVWVLWDTVTLELWPTLVGNQLHILLPQEEFPAAESVATQPEDTLLEDTPQEDTLLEDTQPEPEATPLEDTP